ncbi:hypothetical protein EYF80_062298 [Liparis tanakae]|uniref:Uncharacterized protein n=1 Tax=Liparis tanakae TaxID=230148 RepID=A0A4Z2EF54_9TELE|nr:hypothetical protein EYF80_062298 [Liparis tanakae]
MDSNGNAIQAYGNGTDVGVWSPKSPVQSTASSSTVAQRNPNAIDNHVNAEPGIIHFCGSLQVRRHTPHTHTHTHTHTYTYTHTHHTHTHHTHTHTHTHTHKHTHTHTPHTHTHTHKYIHRHTQTYT